MSSQEARSAARDLPDALVLIGLAWFIATVVGSFAWITHFGWPHDKGSASTGAVAVTGSLFAMLGVIFLVCVLTEIVRRQP